MVPVSASPPVMLAIPEHLFSTVEARQPQACQSCHTGFDHPQWEMYSASKHGIRALLKQNGKLPDIVAAPTCQTCHMQEGNHEVRTAWGYLAFRLPLAGEPDDTQWKEDQRGDPEVSGAC